MTIDSRPADAAPGDRLPPFERRADFDAWNRFAAVNDEFVPIHMDDEAGRQAGLPSAIGMGNLGVAQIHCLLRSWIGAGGRIAAVNVEFRSPAVRGRANSAHGSVTGVTVDGDRRRIDLDVWIEDDTGTTLTSGTAIVETSP